jgi:putative ABC transport system ATP-binding protein
MLDVKNARVTFGVGTADANPVLQDLSLSLEAGEFVTIIGSNGAGKSTLFNVIAGSVALDSGQVFLDGVDITKTAEHRRARSIGRLFQDPRLGTAPSLTIEETLSLVQEKTSGRFPLYRALRKQNREAFRALLAKLDMGLENRLATKVGLLSGGQRQALTLLMATMVPPKLLLLDEHTAALDPVSAAKVTALTTEIVAIHGITTLMITHSIPQALSMGSRTIMLSGGKKALDLSGADREGLTAADVLARYKELNTDRMVFE